MAKQATIHWRPGGAQANPEIPKPLQPGQYIVVNNGGPTIMRRWVGNPSRMGPWWKLVVWWVTEYDLLKTIPARADSTPFDTQKRA